MTLCARSLVVCLGLLLLSRSLAWCGELRHGPFLEEHVWPLSRSVRPDFPLSSVFGPRLLGERSRYDFHRGIDIPTPAGTAVYAVADGVVRLAGKYDFYSDPLVQLRHYRPQNSKAGGYYYSNYMHLSAVAVAEGDRISRGQLLGYSGRSSSGYAHLHLEVRDGGIYQQHCINPLLILPYEDRHRPTVRIDKVDIAGPDSAAVQVTVTMSVEEPDLNRVELALYRRQGNELKEIARRVYDMMDWNRKFTPKKDPTKLLDNPDFNDVQLRPAPFGASSGAYSLTLTFTGLGRIAVQPGLVVTAVAVDVRGNGVEATHQ